jgi:hypothetical protein
MTSLTGAARSSTLDPLHNKANYTYNENDDLTVIDHAGWAIYTYDGLDDQTAVTPRHWRNRAPSMRPNVLTSTDARKGGHQI